ILAAHPRAELVCVVDSDEKRAGEVAADVGSRALGGIEDLPADLQAAVIAVPTTLHEAVAVPLLARGVACLVEKPLATDLAAADRILAAAERGGARLAVGHVERFEPGVRRVVELGFKPRFIECHRLSTFRFRSLDVGVVHDLMIHDLDLVLHFIDSEVESFDASGGTILTDSIDLASVHLVFRNGARANVTASRVSLTPMRRFRLFSSSSYVSLDFTKNYGLVVRKGAGWERGREELRTKDPAELAKRENFVTGELLDVSELALEGLEQPLQAELDSFLRSVESDSEPEVTGRDGRRALELAERISTAIRSQVW
ncbi:MAG TPA: Gfo/Idh/MocA family oxidoreductase, partial [Planctomycetota bacterium]|nr:Gfo/Idh/MocA family oxidoreductase [Planctomycetota bacterium]